MSIPRHVILPVLVLLLALASLASLAGEPVAPEKPIRLFNGKDLAGFTTWLKATGREDPHHVFSVVDGVIRISGEGLGYLATDKAYKNYHLQLEYKWGKYITDPASVPNSGALLNGIGPDGGAGGMDDLPGVPDRPRLRGRPDRHPWQGCRRPIDSRHRHQRNGEWLRTATPAGRKGAAKRSTPANSSGGRNTSRSLWSGSTTVAKTTLPAPWANGPAWIALWTAAI